ncbi:hypothetical protein [Marinirhabdus gelatinilytica]|uniref:Uncharacterized protein n=1 Tax=Marinirhabdus gelatinilytica TaxID=1703343 RepID=A0A370QFY2_9FLAO|nr:hypothetical protein [Marinirhabdus gelatinilytica]RDK87274.1 hypothetical protein C8D94_102459 [Marinirhabdus gelatinilytica]
MKKILAILLLCSLQSWGQNDFESRYFTMTATIESEMPTPALSAFMKKVQTSIYKKSLFSDFTNQHVTAQNFWQPVDMASSTSERTRTSSKVSMERLQAGFGRKPLYGYQTDGKTRVRNEVYRDQVYYAPIYDPYRPFYRNRNYSPYNVPTARRTTTIITIGGDN